MVLTQSDSYNFYRTNKVCVCGGVWKTFCDFKMYLGLIYEA